MALSVKAYLLTYPEQQEIRRFTIDEGSSSNYDYLLSKIRTVFPDIRNKALRLFWKDDDEELVTFSSHEELAGVLGCMKRDVFRVFIKVLDGQEESANQDGCNISSPEPVDQGVGCKSAVYPDNYLGTRCGDKGLCRENKMLRTCTPRACGWFQGPHYNNYCGPRHGRCHGAHHGFGSCVQGHCGRTWGPGCVRGRCGIGGF